MTRLISWFCSAQNKQVRFLILLCTRYPGSYLDSALHKISRFVSWSCSPQNIQIPLLILLCTKYPGSFPDPALHKISRFLSWCCSSQDNCRFASRSSFPDPYLHRINKFASDPHFWPWSAQHNYRLVSWSQYAQDEECCYPRPWKEYTIPEVPESLSLRPNRLPPAPSRASESVPPLEQGGGAQHSLTGERGQREPIRTIGEKAWHSVHCVPTTFTGDPSVT